MTGDAWQDNAACRGLDHKTWYPERGEVAAMRAAKAICQTCPVRTECLNYALTNREKEGVWGGLSGHQRRPMFASLANITVCPVCDGEVISAPGKHRVTCGDECRKIRRNETARKIRVAA